MLLGVPIESILTLLLAASMGFAAHILAKTHEIRTNDDSSVTVWQYFARTPLKTISKGLIVLSAAISLAKPQITPELFGLAASIGYVADSAANHIARLKL